MPRRVCYTRSRSSPEQNLLSYLSAKFTYRTVAQWADHIRQGHVHIHGKCGGPKVAAHGSDTDDMGLCILQQGDCITFDPPRELEPAVDEVHIRVLYEDAHVLVCSKNGNLPVGEGGRYCQNTLVGLLTRCGAQAYHTSETRVVCAKEQNVNVMCSLPLHDCDRTRQLDACDAMSFSAHGLDHESSSESNGTCIIKRKVHLHGTAMSDRAKASRPPSGVCTSSANASSSSPVYRVVHRLDKETSGVVVLAKSLQAAQGLANQFAQHAPNRMSMRLSSVPLYTKHNRDGQCCNDDSNVSLGQDMHTQVGSMTKSYIAVLRGCMPRDSRDALPVMTVTARIGRVADDLRYCTNPAHKRLAKLKMLCYADEEHPDSTASTLTHAGVGTTTSESHATDSFTPISSTTLASAAIKTAYGKHAHTVIRVLGHDDRLGVLVALVEIGTGRTHQIRVHCAHMGFPVLGDKLYDTTRPGCVGYGYAVDDDVYLGRVRGTLHDSPCSCSRNDLGANGQRHGNNEDRDITNNDNTSNMDNENDDSPIAEYPDRGESAAVSNAARIDAVRHLLHAHALGFVHPVDGEQMIFVSSPVNDFMRDVRARSAAVADEFRSLLTRCLNVQ